MKSMKKRSNRQPRSAKSFIFNSTLALLLGTSLGARADEPYVAEVRLFAFNWCPRGWAQANGAILPIQQYQLPFALTGTIYGGNGTTTFALPDLRGRTPLGWNPRSSPAPNLGDNQMGDSGGQEITTLTTAQMPAHAHQQIAATAPATHATPAPGRVLAQAQNAGLYAAGNAATNLGYDSGTQGAGQAFAVRNPHAVMNWCVALQGDFPMRN